MHSWRENVKLLEMVDMPGVVGYQADMAHSMLFTLGYNAEKDRILPEGLRLEGHGRRSTPPTRRSPTRCGRGRSISTSRRTTARSSAPATTRRPAATARSTDPNGRLDIAKHAGYWLRDDKGELTKTMRHICWDGCMFPNAVMEKQETWNNVLGAMVKVRDAHGWRE